MNLRELNLKEFSDKLDEGDCCYKKKLSNFNDSMTAHCSVIEYKNESFYIICSFTDNLISEAFAHTYYPIHPSNASNEMVDKLIDYGKTKGVSVVREKLFDVSGLDLDKEELHFYKKAKPSGGNFASIDLLEDFLGGLENLYHVLMRSYEIFGKEKSD